MTSTSPHFAIPRCLLSGAVTLLATLTYHPLTAAEPLAPWVADQGDGTYKNPVLFADYSDPDVVRVGEDYFLTASSFNSVPGLPILHSRDLVNWRLIGHAIQQMPPRFDAVQHSNGIWAPSIRYHGGYYWIFVGDPDWGILMTRTKDPAGAWEPLHVVKEGKGLIDPCPLWDKDGKAYLVHAFAKSRAGKNSIVIVQEMATDGSGVLGEEHLVIDGRNDVYPTIEGPKIYRHNDWYYIFAPAGGVKEGYQLAARSRSIFGPYEGRKVLEQGSTNINGPHQGGWVDTPAGEDWFLHFQDLGPYGRVVHLNPMTWVDDWPVMGIDYDKNGIGEPVATHRKPAITGDAPVAVPPTTDEFDGALGLQWQWQGNPRDDWASLTARSGWLQLAGIARPAGDLSDAPNQLLQKFPAPKFTATTAIEFKSDEAEATADARAGLVVMAQTYAALLVSRAGDYHQLTLLTGGRPGAASPAPLPETTVATIDNLSGKLWLRIAVDEPARCSFSYSTDGETFIPVGKPFAATPGQWMGAKVGLVCQGEGAEADFDFFQNRVAP